MAATTTRSFAGREPNRFRNGDGAASAGATAIGAAAVGALAVGAMAVGALAVGHLAVRKARIGRLDIGELRVRKIRGAAVGGATEVVPAFADTETRAVADAYVALCRQGRFDDAMEQLFSPDHVRVESLDMIDAPEEMHGLPAIRKRSREFAESNQVHGFTVDGPFVGDNRFAVRFAIDATLASTGERITTPKLDLYSVQGQRIVRSEVYYQDPSLPHG
jgi:ketosteroid isomerase-like protein